MTQPPPLPMTNLQTALLFDPWRDRLSQMSGKVLYAEDGNPKMEQEDNLQKRALVRTHPAVQDALGRLVRLYTNTEKGVSKADYVANYLKIFKVLQPDESQQEAQAEAEVPSPALFPECVPGGLAE
eukprot:TRINITY_DN11394_c0_g1_i5.p1 TRINITY_DN11394_c0_g1~~TRINITY_DN11394_c0_g1_i5.p1  ORF type:complete len:126 (+),score=31.04 TRINITY_DN11394_c0_g1_i5:59-436(+)